VNRESTRDALDVVVSIDAVNAAGYEVVESRKVDEDVYELVLAKPSSRRRNGHLAPVATDGTVANGSANPPGAGTAVRALTDDSPADAPVPSRRRSMWIVRSGRTESPASTSTVSAPATPPKPVASTRTVPATKPVESAKPGTRRAATKSVAEVVSPARPSPEELAVHPPGSSMPPPAWPTADLAPRAPEAVPRTAFPMPAMTEAESTAVDGEQASTEAVASAPDAPPAPIVSLSDDDQTTRSAAGLVAGTFSAGSQEPHPPVATAARPVTGGPPPVMSSHPHGHAPLDLTAEPNRAPSPVAPIELELSTSAVIQPEGVSDATAADAPTSGAPVARGLVPVSTLPEKPPEVRRRWQRRTKVATPTKVPDRAPETAAARAMVTKDQKADPTATLAPSVKRRPFARSTPKVKESTVAAKPAGRGDGARAVKAPADAKRRPFQRAKPVVVAKAAPAPAPAPIRAPSAARPRVEIDPRTGRPFHDPNLPIIDARGRSQGSSSTTASVISDGTMERAQAQSTLEAREPRQSNEFHNHLIARGIVTEEQLEAAHQFHVQHHRHLFEALSELGIVSEDTMAQEAATYYHLPVIDLQREELDPRALDLVPERVAREHMVFPVSVTPEGLFAAVVEPSERLSGLLAQVSGRTATMAIAPASEVRFAIETNYHALTGVAELVEEFEALGESSQRRQQTVAVTDFAAEDAPIVQVVNRILTQAMRDGASDVHIEPADDIVRVRNRVDGVLKVVLVLPAAMGIGLVSRIKIMADMNIVERRRPQDGKFTSVINGKEIDVRVATVATIWGETCVLRVLDKTRSVLSIDDLGMTTETHELYSKMIRSPFGMVLCVGPTGSGKTTTLYASLTEISDVARNVMTIEDPVEYVFPSINQIQTNEQAGLTFATGLKSILRQDSDIVLVGEIRDVETARIAVQSTLTGHFVLSSLHSTDAISALTRFIDMGIESFLIASSVIGIVGQRLVRRTCTECKEPYTPSEEELAFYTRGGGPEKTVFYHGVGCNFCGHTGFKDRIGVYELLAMTPELKRLIVGFATEDELRDLARKQGMRSIQDEAISLIAADKTTSAEVVRSIYSI
jgi:type IV pilus assembly protein PilB